MSRYILRYFDFQRLQESAHMDVFAPRRLARSRYDGARRVIWTADAVYKVAHIYSVRLELEGASQVCT